MDEDLLQAFLAAGISEERARAWCKKKGIATTRKMDDAGNPIPADMPPEPEPNPDSKSLHMYVQGPICGGWIAALMRFFGIQVCDSDLFAKQLADNPDKDVILHIDSPGGVVFDGAKIRAGLQGRQAKQRKVTAYIEGEATSMAAMIAMVANRIVMESYSLFQFHTPIVSMGYSDARELRREARLLEGWEVIMADSFAARTGESAQTFLNTLRRDGLHPFTAKEAQAIGLIDKIMDGTGDDADADPAEADKEEDPPAPDTGDDDDDGMFDRTKNSEGEEGGDKIDPGASPSDADKEEGAGSESGDVEPAPASREAVNQARTLAAIRSRYPNLKNKNSEGSETGNQEDSDNATKP